MKTLDIKKHNLKLDLDKRIKTCHRCPGLNIPRITENAPGYGNINSPVFMIGQSLCTDCMETQVPFTGGSGIILDDLFYNFGMKKNDIFITNLVHCHPINNRPSKQLEIDNCFSFLMEEIKLVEPLLIIGFGRDVRINLFGDSVDVNRMYKNIKIEGTTHKCDVALVHHPAYLWRRAGRNGVETIKYKFMLSKLMRRYI